MAKLPNMFEDVRFFIERSHPGDEISIDSISKYSDGVLVQYTHTIEFSNGLIPTLRVAYIKFGTANGAPWCKWDMIC